MILSTSHRFIFVHVPKTAGQAMMRALMPYSRHRNKPLLRRASRHLPIRESVENAHFRGHETARGFIRKLGRAQFDDFFTFAVVRNPYTHAVSHYEYMKQFRAESIAKRVSAMSFSEYLDDRRKRAFGKDNFFARMPDQAHFVIDDTGTVAVDRILRFENLASDFNALMQELDLDAELKQVNKTKAAKKPLDDYYTDETLAKVRKLYARDFDLFGYSRDLPARG